MANEIWTSYDSAKTLYAFVYRMTDKYIYDVGDAAFEAIGTWNDARAGECDIAMTAVGDVHFADFPVVSAGVYYVSIRERAGASPDTDDKPVAQGVMCWAGSSEFNELTLDTDLTDIHDSIDVIDSIVDEILLSQNRVVYKYDE